MDRRNFLIILSILSLLFIFSIACKQSGEIIPPAVATQRFEATQTAEAGGIVGEVVGAAFSSGATAELVSDAYLVGLFPKAGGNVAHTYATRGEKVSILGSVVLGEVIWYKIETSAGNGWLLEENLKAIE